MTQELMALLIMCLLAPLQAVFSATANARAVGFAWGLGNRDTDVQLPPWLARLKRSHANLIENLGSFIGIVVIAHLVGVHDEYTVAAAWAFVATRILFAAFYTLGITFLFVRTLSWFASLAAIGIIAWRILRWRFL